MAKGSLKKSIIFLTMWLYKNTTKGPKVMMQNLSAYIDRITVNLTHHVSFEFNDQSSFMLFFSV